MEETPFFDASSRSLNTAVPPISQPHRKKRPFWILIVLVFLVTAILFGAFRFFGGKEEAKKEAITPTPTDYVFPTDTPIPSPSITPEVTQEPTVKPTNNPIDKATGLDRSDLDVEVKNGSGTVGAASKASDVLKTFGYHVVSIGNAESFDYQETVIMVKAEKAAYTPLLKKDLETVYAIGEASSTLSASVSADAVVIVGKE